jgi:hypothetical protein
VKGNQKGLALRKSHTFLAYFDKLYKLYIQGVSRATCYNSEERSLGKITSIQPTGLYPKLTDYGDNNDIYFEQRNPL